MAHYDELYTEFYEGLALKTDIILFTCEKCKKECSKRVDSKGNLCKNCPTDRGRGE